jgi:hypothetical protein
MRFVSPVELLIMLSTCGYHQARAVDKGMLLTMQKLKTLTIRHYDFNKVQGMPASVPHFLQDRQCCSTDREAGTMRSGEP